LKYKQKNERRKHHENQLESKAEEQEFLDRSDPDRTALGQAHS
jgi:hypothetical protein